MKQDVIPTQTHLPANFVNRLVAGIAESRASTVINAGGKPLLRLLKHGEWVFGQSDETVQDGSSWVINVATIAHGYCCWIDGELRGETMASVFDRKPSQPAPIDYIDENGDPKRMPYKEQRSFDLKCYDGEDAGTEVLYKTSSVSGMAASDQLFAILQGRAQEDQTYIFPVVQLKKSHYEHKRHGRIYTPILEVVGWVDSNANPPQGNGKLPERTTDDVQLAQPVRKRKAPLGSEAPAEPPQTTQQAHAAPVRRRPGR